MITPNPRKSCGQECRLRLERPAPHFVGPLHLNPQPPKTGLLRLRPLSVGALLRTSNISEAAPRASPSFSVSEKLARYVSSALSGVEHLTLLVGKESIACALIRHFGSLKALSRASFVELRQFLQQSKAEAVIAALSVFAIAEAEHAIAERLENPESIYRACSDKKLFRQGSATVSRFVTDRKRRHPDEG